MIDPVFRHELDTGKSSNGKFMHRFYLSPSSFDPDKPALDGAEAHHARNVLRLEAGARVVVFNGQGHEITAEITQSTRDRIELKKLHEAKTPPWPCRVSLAQAVPKGKNMDLIVQKAVELGAASIIPLLSNRTVVDLEGEALARKQEKWQQIAIEASKQCGQNWLPEVRCPATPRDFFAAAENYDLKLIGSLQSDALYLRNVLAAFMHENKRKPADVLICIGPEGDFTPAELNDARAAGCVPITLGPIVLRVETAAIYCLSVLSYELFA